MFAKTAPSLNLQSRISVLLAEPCIINHASAAATSLMNADKLTDHVTIQSNGSMPRWLRSPAPELTIIKPYNLCNTSLSPKLSAEQSCSIKPCVKDRRMGIKISGNGAQCSINFLAPTGFVSHA